MARCRWEYIPIGTAKPIIPFLLSGEIAAFISRVNGGAATALAKQAVDWLVKNTEAPPRVFYVQPLSPQSPLVRELKNVPHGYMDLVNDNMCITNARKVEDILKVIHTDKWRGLSDCRIVCIQSPELLVTYKGEVAGSYPGGMEDLFRVLRFAARKERIGIVVNLQAGRGGNLSFDHRQFINTPIKVEKLKGRDGRAALNYEFLENPI